MSSVYRIKKTFILPFQMAVAFLLVLLILSLLAGPAWEYTVVAILFVISLIVAVESYEKAFTLSESGFSIRKFFRTKDFTWEQITHLGVLIIGNKVYFPMTTTRGFYVLSNLVQDHPLMIRSLAQKLGDEKVEPEVISYLDHPIERTSWVILMWIAVMILVAIIITKVVKS